MPGGRVHWRGWLAVCSLALVALAGGGPPAPARGVVTVRRGLPRLNREAERPGERERETGAYEREYWYRYIRSLPGGVLPPDAEGAARRRAQRFALAARA